MSEDPSGDRPATGPVAEGLAVMVELPVAALPGGSEVVGYVAVQTCAECGVLVWDVEAHWTDAHAHRLQALRANAARG